jgi:hypothetical protein
VYVTGIWQMQLLAGRYLFRRYASWEKVILNTLLALPVGVAIMISLMFLLSKLI